MSNQNRNYFKEKLVLREEEKSLKEMLAKFQDQLNRLKIEELALLSHIKMQEESKKPSSTSGTSKRDAASLIRGQKTTSVASDGGSSISSAVPVGVVYYKDPSKELEEDLDLAVRAPSYHQGLDQDLGEEEEEEEEEEEDENDLNALYSYMDTN